MKPIAGLDKALTIDGWMSPDELIFLGENSRIAKTALQLGCYKGRSSYVIGKNIQESLLDIDSFVGDFGNLLDADELASTYRNNVQDLLGSKVQLLIGNSHEILPTLDRTFDMIFIDGSHTYDDVKRDIILSFPLLNPGGLICGYDYSHSEDVKRAVDEVFQGKAAQYQSTSIWHVRIGDAHKKLHDKHAAITRPIAASEGKKLHLGCGAKILPDYINIDLYHPQADLQLDITDLSSFPDNSVDEVFMNAVFEHLYPFEHKKALSEWWRILKPNGVLRIDSIPDFEELVKAYSRRARGNTRALFDIEEVARYTHGEYGPADKAGGVHKDIFTKQKMKKLLEDSRFVVDHIESACWGNEPHPVNINVTAHKKAAASEPVKKTKSSFGAVYCVYDDDIWLTKSFESIYDACHAIYFLVSDKPWQGQATDNHKTIECIRSLPDPESKIRFVPGTWTNETDQRNAGLALLQQAAIDYCFVVDADEIYDADALKRMMTYASQQESIACWHMTWDTYWKSQEFVIAPREPFEPVVFVKVGSALFEQYRGVGGQSHARIPPEVGHCHHMSYARSDEQIYKKITTFSHALEIQTGWFTNVWKRWDEDHSLANLHPTHPRCYQHALRRSHDELPPVLKKHIPGAKYTPNIELKKRLTSIIILTFNQLKFTKECIESLQQNTPEPHEIIFVDNGSTDGTVQWLKKFAKQHPNIRVIENRTNLGFSKGCNQGISASFGDRILLLNNDVVVTQGWLSGMIECLESASDTGIVGPMTNNISGPQKIDAVEYLSVKELAEFAGTFRERYRHRRIPLWRIVGFCMLFRRSLAERIGLFDERFVTGNFEDDDYCLRASLEGFRNLAAGDVFIHHYGSTSFKGNKIDYSSSLSRNRSVFDEKWRIDSTSPTGKKLAAYNAVERAKRLFQQQMPDRAVAELMTGIKYVPDETSIYYYLSEMLIDVKQFQPALDSLQFLPETERTQVKALTLIGYCKEGLGNLDEASAIADKILAISPRNAFASNLKGIISYKRGAVNDAEISFKKAVELDPGYGEPYTNLGVMAWAANNRQAGLEYLEKGFILSPLQTDIGELYFTAIRSLKAFERFEKVLLAVRTLYPLNKKIVMLHIEALVEQGKFDAALKEIQLAMSSFGIDENRVKEALSKQPANPEVRQLYNVLLEMNKQTANLTPQQKEIEDILAAVNRDAAEGNWIDAAKKIYELLKKYPDAGIAYAALGSVFIGRGDMNSAIGPLEKAAELLPNEPSIGVQLAQLYRATGLQDKAVQQIIKSVNMAPTNPEILFTFATIAAEIGNNAAAQTTLSKLKQIEPNYPGMKELQNQLEQKSNPAVEAKWTADENPEELLRRGTAFLAASKWQKAIDDLERVITLLPSSASELSPCLGYAYSQIGRFDKAVACYKKVLTTNPPSADAYYNMGKAYKGLGDFDGAKSCYADALQRDPQHVDSCFNLANLNLEMGELDEAIFLYKKTIKLPGEHLGALCNMGVAYREKGELSAAEEIYKQAIGVKPDLAEAHWNLGIVRLLRGDFQEGWKGYEWRWRKKDFKHAKRDFKQPQWDGTDLAGKTILVHAEQGMGDMIQCMRLFPFLAQRGAKVVVECQKELATLVRTVQGVQEVVSTGDLLPSFDVHCPVMTLPSFFINFLDQIPAAVPYVSLDESVLEKWRGRLEKDPAQFKVGIVWAGNQLYKNDLNRSCPITIFAKMFDLDRVSFYSLQKDERAVQLRAEGKFGNVIELSSELIDFMDTACLMECLDLVISVDTAAAHLAGCLAKTVWTLLPFAPDWRWMLSREDSPWYPTMRLFRQKTAKDWEGVIDSVRKALQIKIKSLPAMIKVQAMETGGVSVKPTRAGFTSIVLHNLRQKEIIQNCLSNLEINTPEPHEVIFLAGANDAIMKWLKREAKSHPNYRIVQTTLPSDFAKGCNRAIRESSGDYLVLMSADCIVAKHWLSDMVACMTCTVDAGVVGPMTNLGHGLQITDLGRGNPEETADDAINRFRMRNRHRRRLTGKVAGFCILFKRSLVQKIGLFDEKLGPHTCADDYCLRAALLGHRNLIAGDVYIPRMSSKEIISTTQSDRKTLKNKWGNIDRNSTLGQRLVMMTAIDQAWGFHHSGQTDKAAEILLQEVKRTPNGQEAFYNLAEMLIESKRFKEALDVLSLIPQNGADMRRLILTGYCREGLGHHEEAENTAEEVLKSCQYDAMALNLKGILAYKKDDLSKAEDFFLQAVDSDPSYGEPYTNLGILKWARKGHTEALHFLETGFVLSPAIPDIAKSYYSAIISEKAWKRAETIFQEAKSLHPSNRRIVFHLIEILLRQEKFDLAMDEIEEAIIRFAIDDGFIDAALAVRKKIGPRTIRESSKRGATLSLCMIVKNEMRCLAKCLGSVKDLVDEMIVVDTGSTDRTRDIAEAFGAQLFAFPWTGDFSEARNYSLDRASGDWILILDGDEMISRQDLAELRGLVARKSAAPLAYSFVTRNYLTAVHNIGWIANDGTYPEEEAGSGWVSSIKVRMFSRDKRIRFINPVHEIVEPSLRNNGITIKDCHVPIHHYGKLDMGLDVSKGHEYYLLGKKKLEENENDLNAIQELAIQAAGLDKHEEARDLWLKALTIQPEMLAAHINLANTYLSMNNFTEALCSAKMAIALRPDMREVVCNYAVCEMYAGDIERAVEVLETFFKKDKEYPLATVMLLAAYFASGRTDKGSELLSSLKLTGSSAFGDAICPFINKLIKAGRVVYAEAILEALDTHKICSSRLSKLQEECENKKLPILQSAPRTL